MILLNRGRLTYYIKDEAVIVGINDFQYTAYTVYPLQNRKPFNDFRKTLLESKEDEYNSVLDLITLAQRFTLKGVASHKPSESEING